MSTDSDNKYAQPFDAERASRLLYELDGLMRHVAPDTQRLKDVWYEVGIAVRCKIAATLGIVPDSMGRIIVPPKERANLVDRAQAKALFNDYKERKAA